MIENDQLQFVYHFVTLNSSISRAISNVQSEMRQQHIHAWGRSEIKLN